MRKSFFLLLFSIVFLSFGQKKTPIDSASIVSIITNYSFQIPAGDIANRFGVSSNIGLSILYKKKSNFLIGLDGLFLFGNSVKEDNILSNILTNQEQMIDYNGQVATIRIFERGFQIYGKAGKIFPINVLNPNSGFVILVGAGLLQHKIFYDSIGDRTPQLNDEYKKGYDRLSNGLSITQFLGYIHFDKRRKINFYAGLDLSQAWTKNRRSYNFDTKGQDNTLYFDSLNGIKIGWILPLYEKQRNQFYYN